MAVPACYNGLFFQIRRMSLKTLIVDDEPIARQVLREELECIPGIILSGEADNGTTALTLIERNRPDVVLLDLQMPDMGGLDVIRQIGQGSHTPVIVIVTAYDEFAVRAFEAGAIDYLLKPVAPDRLTEAMERARLVSGKQAAERLTRLQEVAGMASAASRKIIGKAGQEYFLLNLSEILAFQADGDLVWIVTAKRKYLATQTLKALEERLKDSSFRRIHRGALVNVDQVRKMSTLSSQRWLITLSNDQEFIVSKRQAHSVRELLNW